MTAGESASTQKGSFKGKPHIVLVIARGEAVRNFLYSDTLRILSENARVTLLSVLHDDAFRQRFAPFVEEIIPLREYGERKLLGYLYHIIWHAHYRWLWSEKAKNKWEILSYQATTLKAKAKFALWKGLMRALANQPTLRALTAMYDWLSWKYRPSDEFDCLFNAIQPDLVFNTSHIHAPIADLPMRVARRLGIPTATFIFSWDNLTTRGRITVPYDYYLVWHEHMRSELLSIYPFINPDHVFVTGTPQFDFHFKPEYWLTKEELCRRIGADPSRPIVLYTTGKASDFPEEHRHVELVIRILQEVDYYPKPQLVVRTYVKGTSPEMRALAERNIPGVVFPPVLWDEKWYTPQYEDLSIYTSLLRHCLFGINAASTVSLELLMHDKPVINIGFNPPGSQLPYCLRWVRHIEFDHYRPVAQSGAVMVAKSPEDMEKMIKRALYEPQADSEKRKRFIKAMFGDTLDGRSGERVAMKLLELADKARTLSKRKVSARVG